MAVGSRISSAVTDRPLNHSVLDVISLWKQRLDERLLAKSILVWMIRNGARFFVIRHRVADNRRLCSEYVLHGITLFNSRVASS